MDALALQQQIELAAAHCLQRGVRLTPIRQQVLSLVLQAGTPIKAYDLLAKITPGTASMSPPTVYRALDFLVEIGLVHKLEGMNAFIACNHHHTHHSASAFVVCPQCKQAAELPIEPITTFLGAMLAKADFTQTPQHIEITTICQQCAHAH